MDLTPDPIPAESLRKLHRDVIDSEFEVRRILQQASRLRVDLQSGVSSRSTVKGATIEEVAEGYLQLRTRDVRARVGRQLFFKFELGSSRYFFAADVSLVLARNVIRVTIPGILCVAERRESFRFHPGDTSHSPTRLEFTTPDGEHLPGVVKDWSYHGAAIEFRSRIRPNLGDRLILRFLDGGDASKSSFAEVRHYEPIRGQEDWHRVGLSVSEVLPEKPVRVDRRESILSGALVQQVPSGIRLKIRNFDRDTFKSAHVAFRNDRGEAIYALVDTYGDSRGAPAVLIPPAWGKTKETLLPLARAIIETFAAVREPVTVMRFDGTHRRGQSHRDEECRSRGSEHLRFRFSGAVRDIHSCVQFLDDTAAYNPSSVVLVTVSLASIEGRRAIAENPRSRFSGWISVVGLPDLQSSLHVISGGVDFGAGLLRGIRFGLQEIFGVLIDIDYSGLDAIDARLSFLEDARRDMRAITVPITWIHGRHDAWVDLERVRHLLACGDTSKRQLVELPIGHQLRTSRDAAETFALVGSEVGRMALGRALNPVVVESHGHEARAHDLAAPSPSILRGLRDFWTEYLLGRENSGGFKLLTATSAYREFFETQVDELRLRDGDRVADLGAGTCELAARIRENGSNAIALEIHQLDFVLAALRDGRERDARIRSDRGTACFSILADLDIGRTQSILPLQSESYDAALASLLVSYLSEPLAFLVDVWRILKPSGRIVISTLRRDADLSRVYVDSLPERYSSRALELFGSPRSEVLDHALPRFLNAAARILELEEQGRFRFYDAPELAEYVERAGFVDVRARLGLGIPPQAVIITARRP